LHAGHFGSTGRRVGDNFITFFGLGNAATDADAGGGAVRTKGRWEAGLGLKIFLYALKESWLVAGFCLMTGFASFIVCFTDFLFFTACTRAVGCILAGVGLKVVRVLFAKYGFCWDCAAVCTACRHSPAFVPDPMAESLPPFLGIDRHLLSGEHAPHMNEPCGSSVSLGVKHRKW
jgi:hypothetical protein